MEDIEGRCAMWVVELNLAGHRFTRRVRTPHTPVRTITPRMLLRCSSQFLHDRVA
ncbi:hypothetical protein [Mycolicibacterium fortuitum]|uniref:hypothetical protein n=1 Tax=Mycolicibacterium fortuitum TaxID=1766 RepID=UPI0013F4BDC3|nr:hypothetical protein [Mycolicibacterium fortuitum]UHJ53384.1 hypothetical protein LT337_17130 [Mycolicibacterium fortuitum]